jgi:moderate conductance mechanosensitive channel
MRSRRWGARPSWHQQVLGGIVALALAWLMAVGATAAEPGGPGSAAEAESEPVSLPQPLSPETIRDLVARLSDDQVRALLLSQLDRTASTETPATDSQTVGMVGELEDGAVEVRALWQRRIAALPDLPGALPFLLGRVAEGKGTAQLLLTAVAVALIFAVGIVAEMVFRRLTTGMRSRTPDHRVEAFTSRLGYLLQRFGWQVLDLLVFGVAIAAAFLALYQGHEATRLTLMTYLLAIVLLRLVADGSRFLLAPHAHELRLIPFDDHDAQRLHRWIVAVAAIGTFGFLTGDLLALLDFDPATLDAFGALVGVAFVAALIAMIWQTRRPIARLIRGEPTGHAPIAERLRRFLAQTWHLLASAYVLVIFATYQVREAFGQETAVSVGILSLLLVAAIPLADAALSKMGSEYFAARRAAAGDAGAERVGYEAAVERALHIVLWLVGFLIFARLWDIDIYTVTQEGIGDTAAGALFNIVVTVLLAYVGWEIVKAMIDRRIEMEGPAPVPGEVGGEGGEGSGHGASRLRTLLPLARKAIFATLVVMVVMIILSSLGVDIGPLLAGAGVVGLAIGFGAQTLVRDIVSGVFFLVDDAFRVGEYIDLGNAKGTVEKISIRSMQLRHHRGALNTVPFGEISYLTNYSRDWAIMKLEFRVTYDTDVMLVKKIFKQINADLMANPEIAPNLLAPLKSQGVMSMEDSAMIIRAKFTAKPGEQFVIRREVYTRVQKAFEEAGIKFAHRQVTVHVPDAAIEEERPGAVGAIAGAAARRVIEEEEAQAAAKAPA